MLTLTHVDHTPEAEARIFDLLTQHAIRLGVPFETEHWIIEAHEDGEFFGGLSAIASKDFVFVSYLAVIEAAQGRGIGKQLLQALEDRAKEAGKKGVWLDTFAFQAPNYYPTLGYKEFGHLDDCHFGHGRTFFAKYF